MWNRRNRHDERHQLAMGRYVQGDLTPSETVAFMKQVAHCPTCQEELPLLQEAAHAVESGEACPASREAFRDAVGTLHRMHSQDLFRRRLLLPLEEAPSPFRLTAWRLSLAGGAAIALLAIVLLPHFGSVSVPSSPLPVSRTEVAAMTAPVPVPAAQAPAAQVPAPAAAPVRMAQKTRSLRPVDSPAEQKGLFLDSAQMVYMINYITGNIPQNDMRNVGFNGSGACDAVDLAVALNASVANVSGAELERLQHQAEQRVLLKSRL